MDSNSLQLNVLCPQKTSLLFFNQLHQNWPILMIFGTLNPQKISHENFTGLSTSPVRCSHFTWGNPKKSFSTVLFIHTLDYLCYLRRKQTVINFPTPPEDVTTLTCELQSFLIWLKVYCVLSNVGSFCLQCFDTVVWVAGGASGL